MNEQQKVVVITGGLGLIGKAFGTAAAAAGHHVVLAGIEPETIGHEMATALQTTHNTPVQYVQCDITAAEQIQQLIATVNQEAGRIDVLVNNAYPRNAAYGKPFEEVAYADFVENVGMNVGGYFLCAQQFLNYFVKQGHGNIINIASIYGVVAPRFDIYEGSGFTMPVEYSVIKSGIIHLTKYITRYFKGKNIRCNSISPGGVYNNHQPAFRENYAKYATNKGMIDPEDLCGALLFLIADSSAMINGQNLVVDDGWSL